MSGDVDTSIGNSLINYAIFCEVIERQGFKRKEYSVIVNGDDSLIFSRRKINVEKLKSDLRTLNMETKIAKQTENIHLAEFCQTKMVLTSDGRYTMMYNPKKMLSTFGMHYKHMRLDQEFLYQMAHGMVMMHKNTPLHYYWDIIRRKLYASCKHRFRTKFNLLDLKVVFQIYEQRNTKWAPSPEFTASMFDAWGEELYFVKQNIHNLLQQRSQIFKNITIDHNDRKIHLG